ncbi:hypothetical protein BHM03_00033051 [Ensete ventricosum]|nr:hypothetical protein BHM03_00033051 [Ensete ventricosum]
MVVDFSVHLRVKRSISLSSVNEARITTQTLGGRTEPQQLPPARGVVGSRRVANHHTAALHRRLRHGPACRRVSTGRDPPGGREGVIRSTVTQLGPASAVRVPRVDWTLPRSRARGIPLRRWFHYDRR